ncbi:MAG: hypothetical protein ACPG5O_11725 [Pseudoalteromonas tetraodonis]
MATKTSPEVEQALSTIREQGDALRRQIERVRTRVDAKGRVRLTAGKEKAYLSPTPEDVFAYEDEYGEPLSALRGALMQGRALAAVRAIRFFGKVPEEKARALVLKAGAAESIEAAFAAVDACHPADIDATIAALTSLGASGEASGATPTDDASGDGDDPNE